MTGRDENCPWCGRAMVHYLLHICPECECHYSERTIPGEPHMGGYLEATPNPDCPVHFAKGRDDV